MLVYSSSLSQRVGALKKKFGHYFSWAFFWFLFFTKNWDFTKESLSLFLYVCYDLIFFLVFQLTLQVQSLNHYVPNIDVYHTYSIYIVACLVCYYRALPIFFLIHLKRWLNNENLILPNKICKNFLISNASLILALDHQKQRVIREYYNIYGPWTIVTIVMISLSNQPKKTFCSNS